MILFWTVAQPTRRQQIRPFKGTVRGNCFRDVVIDFKVSRDSQRAFTVNALTMRQAIEPLRKGLFRGWRSPEPTLRPIEYIFEARRPPVSVNQ